MERFPEPFRVSFELQVESTQQMEGGIAWQQLPHPQAHPITCFSTIQEQEEIQELFGGTSNGCGQYIISARNQYYYNSNNVHV